jgi:hypothetical protein
VSENVNAATWHAHVDSLVYGLLQRSGDTRAAAAG